MKAEDLKIGNVYKYSNKNANKFWWLSNQHCAYIESCISQYTGNILHKFYFFETKKYFSFYPDSLERAITEI